MAKSDEFTSFLTLVSLFAELTALLPVTKNNCRVFNPAITEWPFTVPSDNPVGPGNFGTVYVPFQRIIIVVDANLADDGVYDVEYAHCPQVDSVAWRLSYPVARRYRGGDAYRRGQSIGFCRVD